MDGYMMDRLEPALVNFLVIKDHNGNALPMKIV